MFVQSDRLVSATVFKVLGALSFDIMAMPAHFVEAALLTHAAASEGVHDNFARYITKGEFESFAGKNRVAVLQGDAIIRRSKVLLKASKVGEFSKIEMLGIMKQQVVKCILKKLEKRNGEFPTLEAVALEFVHAMAKETGDAVEEASASGGASQGATSLPNAVRYDGHGLAVGVGKMTAQNKGFKVGGDVRLGGKTDDQRVWRITSMDDSGNVDVAQVRDDGGIGEDVAKLSLDKLMNEYKASTVAMELLDGWPKNDGKVSDEIFKMMCRSQVEMCLGSMVHGQTPPASDLRIIHKPARRVLVTREMKIGELVMPPWSLMIAQDTDPEKQCDFGVRAKVVAASVSGEMHTLYYNIKPCVREKLSGALWCCRVTHDRGESNCELVDFTMKVSCKEAGKAAVVAGDVTIPRGINTKPLRENGEVLFYRPQPAPITKKRKIAAVLESKASKQAAK